MFDPQLAIQFLVLIPIGMVLALIGYTILFVFGAAIFIAIVTGIGLFLDIFHYISMFLYVLCQVAYIYRPSKNLKLLATIFFALFIQLFVSLYPLLVLFFPHLIQRMPSLLHPYIKDFVSGVSRCLWLCIHLWWFVFFLFCLVYPPSFSNILIQPQHLLKYLLESNRRRLRLVPVFVHYLLSSASFIITHPILTFNFLVINFVGVGWCCRIHL